MARHRADKAHIEVLFPADEGVIGAAVNNGGVLRLQRYGNGGKLGLALGVQPVGVGTQRHAAEAGTFRQRPQEVGIAATPHRRLNIRQRQQAACRRLYRDGLGAFPLQNTVKGHIGKPRQNDPVHFIEGIGGKRQIAPPQQIIKQRCHSKKHTSPSPAIIIYRRQLRKGKAPAGAGGYAKRA